MDKFLMSTLTSLTPLKKLRQTQELVDDYSGSSMRAQKTDTC